MYGMKMSGAGRICFQFSAQLRDVVVHCASTGITLVSPDFVEHSSREITLRGFLIKYTRALNCLQVRATRLPLRWVSMEETLTATSPKTNVSASGLVKHCFAAKREEEGSGVTLRDATGLFVSGSP
jgi:hypothetical protein